MDIVEPRVTWIIVPKHDFAVRCWFDYDSVMSFKVFNAVEEFDINSNNGTWVLMECGGVKTFDEWKEQEWELDGHLRSDGCINWQTNPECMHHACGPQIIEYLKAVFTVVYAVGKRHMNLLGKLLDEKIAPLPEGYIEILDHAKTNIDDNHLPKLIS